MKKALSIVLSVAMLMTCIFSMAIIPASAANGYDFLWEANFNAQEGISYEFIDDSLVVTATAAGQEIALELGEEANLNNYPFWELSIDSEIPFDVAIYDANNSKWMFAAGDFCYNFEPNNGAANPIPAGAHDVKFSLTGAYTWTGDPLPANAAVKSITFIAKAAGTFTVYKCAMTDGTEDVVLFPENTWNDNWNAFDFLCDETTVDLWVGSAPDQGGNSEIVVGYDEDNMQMTFGNTNGNWPSASIEVGAAYDYETTAIDVNLSVLAGAQTTLYVFFGDATPTDFEGAGKAYGTILADAGAGNYSGYVKLSDILPADSDVIDENGKVVISYVKIFAISGGVVMDPAVLVNWLDVCYIGEEYEYDYPQFPFENGKGDIDFDNDVDTYDALMCFNAALDVITLDEEAYFRADVDEDQIVFILDALYIFLDAAGFSTNDLINNPDLLA